MGFFKSLVNAFSGGINCPACGTPGAQKVGDQIKCLNPVCRYFGGAPGEPPRPPQPPQAPVQPPMQPPQRSAPQSFSGQSGAGTVAIWYRNFQGQSKTFTADAGSLRRKHNHIVAKVAPSGKEIALSRDRIQNLHEIDAHLPPRDRSDARRPNAREKQVLNYHKKYGTTSPLYEKIRAKYPDW